MSLKVEDLYLPDRKKTGSLWAGTSGSGKTTAVISTLRQAILTPSFGEKHRFVIVDPKVQSGDYDLLVDPTTDLMEALDKIRDERVTLYWPYYNEFDSKTMELDIAVIVDHLFKLSDEDPKSSFTFILDEASIVITPNSVPASLKRLSVQGRAKRIVPHYISQRPMTNRWLDANMTNLFLFRTLAVDADNLSKRYGGDFVQTDEAIRSKPYSFVRFNLEDGNFTTFNPVPLPKRLPRKEPDNYPKRVMRWWNKIIPG